VDKHSYFFLSSTSIVYYVALHPIIWQERALAQRGGSGDRAGMTPTPAVQEFLSLLHAKRDLFTQQEYTRHCIAQWPAWFDGLTTAQQQGVVAKLYNNFYPAMIDALHVLAMLAEHGVFEFYLIDAKLDVADKIDLELTCQQMVYRLALFGPTREARQDRAFKVENRPGTKDEQVIAIQMPWDRPKQPGNKRWYEMFDRMPLLRAALPTDES
jgi:hypothetical protein